MTNDFNGNVYYFDLQISWSQIITVNSDLIYNYLYCVTPFGRHLEVEVLPYTVLIGPNLSNNYTETRGSSVTSQSLNTSSVKVDPWDSDLSVFFSAIP